MRIVVNNLTTDFECENRNDLNRFESLFDAITVDVPGAKYTWDFKKGGWDGRVLLCEQVNKTFTIETGLAPRVIRLLNGKVSATVVDNRGAGTPTCQPTQIELRDYQLAGVMEALGNTTPALGWWPRGVIKVATGGGKTEMAVALYEMNPVPTMFLVHRKDLLVQAAERFAKYGHTVGRIGDSKFDPDSDVTIATMQTLHRIIDDPDNARHAETMKLIKNTKQLFFDECHLMASSLEKGNLFVDTASHFENAVCRWGLTATPFMRGNYDNMLLESVTGEILYEISNQELIDMGYLTPPKIRVIEVPGKTEVKRPKKSKGPGDYWRLVSDKCIVSHVKRNELIAKEILKGEGPMLCLVSTVKQAENVQAAIKKLGGAVPMLLSGKDKTETRRQAVRDLQSGKVRAILCTTIFDEGVDIPELRKVILASGGKSQVKLLQRIGRGLRLAEGKSSVEIVDFADRHHKMVRTHALDRMKRFKEEGFEVIK